MKKYIFVIAVLVAFNDKENPGKVIKPGETLSTDDLARVNNIVSRGLGTIQSVEAVDGAAKQNGGGTPAKTTPKVVSVLNTEYDLSKVKEALNAIGVETAKNAGVEAVEKVVAELTEEQVKSLSEKLSEAE